MKYRVKDITIRDAEGPYFETTEFGDGTAKVKLEFYVQTERAGVETTTWYHVDFRLDYDELACAGRSIAASISELQRVFDERIEAARDSVRRQLG